MKPHPRIRKTIKWAGAAATVLLVVVWIGSKWIGLECSSGRSVVASLYCGCVEFSMYDAEALPGSPMQRAAFEYHIGAPNWIHFYRPWTSTLQWRLLWNNGGKLYSQLTIPLWMCALPAACGTVFAFRVDHAATRRARFALNHCPKCNYHRTGILQDAKCPECGAVPASV